MPRRIRTTKNLAKRMDLQYFRHADPLRSWRLWLSILIPVIALGWFAVERARSQKIYSSGPLSAAHAVLGKKCDVCHVTTLGFFRAKVSDNACSKCHDAPAHHADKVASTISCGSCHIEHRGSLRLASTEDTSCTQCHANLSIRSGNSQYVRTVKDFDEEHPEFAALRPGASDPGKIKLNHHAHLVPNLAGPSGPVQMDCQDCHGVTAMGGAWPYAMSTSPAQPNPVAARTGGDRKHSHSQDYMQPILYFNHCAGCHVKDLQFDKRFDQSVPHDKPEVVQAFLVRKFRRLFRIPSRSTVGTVAPERLLPGKMKLQLQVPHNRQESISPADHAGGRVVVRKRLQTVPCDASGEWASASGGKVVRPPARWLQHAEFDHNSHRLLTCTARVTSEPPRAVRPPTSCCPELHPAASVMRTAGHSTMPPVDVAPSAMPTMIGPKNGPPKGCLRSHNYGRPDRTAISEPGREDCPSPNKPRHFEDTSAAFPAD